METRYLSLLLLASSAFAQSTTLSFVDAYPCCLAPDGHGNVFSVSALTGGGTSVSRVSADGTVLSTFHFQVGTFDGAQAAALDPQGRLWVAGRTGQSITRGFIAELDGTGAAVLYSTTFGGADPKGSTAINAIAFDPDGNLYAGGSTNQSDFPYVAGGFKSKFGSPQETAGWFFDSATQYGFVAKFAGGTRLASTAMLGGEQLMIAPCPSNAQCYSTQPLTSVSALAVDAAGIVTAAGTTNVADFPVTPGAYQTACQCQNEAPNAFISRLNAQGSGLVWSTLLGATTPETSGFGMSVSGIALDSTGNVVVGGITAAPNFPVTAGVVGPAFAASPAAFSGYVSKLDSTGARLLLSTFYGGAKVSQVSAPRLDAHGNIWLTAQVIDRSGLALGKDSLVLGSAINSSLVAALSPDASSVAFSEVLPNGAAGQDLLVNSDSTITVAGPSRVAASLTAIAQGLVLRHPRPDPPALRYSVSPIRRATPWRIRSHPENT